MMADFQSVFWNFNFSPKVRILQRLQPLHDGRFSKWSNFWKIGSFLERFFAQNNFSLSVDWFLMSFLPFYFLPQTDDFAMAIALLANILNGLIFRKLGVFQMVFLQRITLLVLDLFLAIFFCPKLMISQTLQPFYEGHFGQYSKWSHFQNIRCFQSGFLHRITVFCLYIGFFFTFLSILFFYPK